jgi:hypothetical protein
MWLKKMRCYAAAFECWIGGADNPDRIEGFVIAAADAKGSAYGLYFALDRSCAHAVLIPRGKPQTEASGAMFKLLV